MTTEQPKDEEDFIFLDPAHDPGLKQHIKDYEREHGKIVLQKKNEK